MPTAAKAPAKIGPQETADLDDSTGISVDEFENDMITSLAREKGEKDNDRNRNAE